MLDYHIELARRLEVELHNLSEAKEVPLHQVVLPKSPRVYMLFFDGELQYTGSSENLNQRIKTNLIQGNREPHTLINKLCYIKKWRYGRLLIS